MASPNHYQDYKRSHSHVAEYWKNWPRGGEYMNDLLWSEKVATSYLNQIVPRLGNLENCAVVFDVDETLVFGDPEETIGVREMELGDFNGQSVFILPPNSPIVKICSTAKRLGLKIIILTARPATSKIATITNLDMFRIPYDFIIVNNNDSDPQFKINTRRDLQSKYNVILTVGDQPCDVLLCGKSAVLKLPDPKSKCAYFNPGIL
jgi:hypothetical protein